MEGAVDAYLQDWSIDMNPLLEMTEEQLREAELGTWMLE